jgi:hypothetical protein
MMQTWGIVMQSSEVVRERLVTTRGRCDGRGGELEGKQTIGYLKEEWKHLRMFDAIVWLSGGKEE